MDIQAAQLHFTDPGSVNHIDIVIDREVSVDSIKNAIRAKLPQGLEVKAPRQRKADIYAITQGLQMLLLALGLAVLAAAFLIAFNRLSTGLRRAIMATRASSCSRLNAS